jgi:hypothetical protein
MITKQRWIAGSRRLYAKLINLYPKEHVAEYGPAMMQVFTDQCREVIQGEGFPGLAFLWLRTMADLGKTAVSEHMHARNSRIGLPEIAPIVWTNTILVIIPGLAWLIFYTAALIWNAAIINNMEFWSIILFAIPIVWAWWHTKVYPVWGLVPAGMLLYLAFETIYNVPFRLSGFHTGSWFLLTAAFLILIVLMGWRYVRHWHPSRGIYVWVGICVFANLTQVVLMIFYSRFYSSQVSNWNWSVAFSEATKNSYPSVWFVMEETTGLLLFIVCTSRFARQYGNLSVLFLPGYFFMNYLSFRAPSGEATTVYPLVLMYRLFLTILLPLWIVRASSVRSRSLGIFIPAVLAFLALAALDRGQFAGWLWRNMTSQYMALLAAWSVFRAVSFTAGFILADQLCRAARPAMAPSLSQARISSKTVQA